VAWGGGGEFSEKKVVHVIYKVVLNDGKAVVLYGMNAARIIGSITCVACLKDRNIL
jgi:hypothetical protein